jgi:hypothetical protein
VATFPSEKRIYRVQTTSADAFLSYTVTLGLSAELPTQFEPSELGRDPKMPVGSGSGHITFAVTDVLLFWIPNNEYVVRPPDNGTQTIPLLSVVAEKYVVVAQAVGTTRSEERITANVGFFIVMFLLGSGGFPSSTTRRVIHVQVFGVKRSIGQASSDDFNLLIVHPRSGTDDVTLPPHRRYSNFVGRPAAWVETEQSLARGGPGPSPADKSVAGLRRTKLKGRRKTWDGSYLIMTAYNCVHR